jgi:hypothetical protein
MSPHPECVICGEPVVAGQKDEQGRPAHLLVPTRRRNTMTDTDDTWGRTAAELEELSAIYGQLLPIPAPPDATEIGDWDYHENPAEPDRYSRYFDVRRWLPCEITVGALQSANVVFSDGRYHAENIRISDWEISLDDPRELTPDRARQLAAALIEAADELERRSQ